MMSQVILEELRVVVVAFFSGAVITVVYDVIRIFRRLISHGNLLIGVEDFLFWIWTSLWTFSMLYRTNDGSLRIYTILAMVFGMIVYYNTVSEFFVKYMGKNLKKVLAMLSYPLKQLWKGIIMRKNR